MKLKLKPNRFFRCWKTDDNFLCLGRKNHNWELAIYNSKIGFKRKNYMKKEIAKIGIWRVAKLWYRY